MIWNERNLVPIERFEATDGTRTRDLTLTKGVLYH